MRKRIYVACPITRGDRLHNHRQADAAMLAIMRAGHSPFNPALSCYAGGAHKVYLGPTGMEEYAEVRAVSDHQAHGEFRQFSHQDWLDMDFSWVAVSDAVLRLPGESKGADMEVNFARDHNIPVYHDLPTLLAALASRPD